MSGEPPIEIKWNFWCDKHLRPLKKEWPKGAALVQVALFQSAMSSPGVQLVIEGLDGDIQAGLEKCAPLCCFIGDRTATLIVEKALKGIVHCCECDNRYPHVPCKLCSARKPKN